MSTKDGTPQSMGEKRWRLGPLIVTAAPLLAISLLLGRYPNPYLTRPSALADDELALRVVLDLRLPRILAAFALGAVLSASGTVFQTIFRNPLVESGFLGVSQGASFGASLAIVALGGRATVIQICAGAFAFLGLASSYIISQRIR